MNKKIKSILITLFVGLVALISLAVVMNVLENLEEEEGTSSKKQLIKYTVGDVASVKVELKNGEYYYVTEDAGSSVSNSVVQYKVTFNGIYAGLEYDTSLSKQLVSCASQLTAERDMGFQETENLSMFGLDVPTSVVTILTEDGAERKIYMGNVSSGGSGYYCMVDGDDHVYVIGPAKGEVLIKAPNEMRVKQFILPTSLDNIDKVEWKYGNYERISIYRDLESSVFNPYLNYYIDAPWSMPLPVNGDDLTHLFENMTSLSVNEYITPKADGSDAVLADYGLDDPWGYFKITCIDGTVYEFSFGDYSDDINYYCYMRDHSTGQIYTVSYEKASHFADYTPIDVTSPYLILANLDDIESVIAEYDGRISDFVHKRVSTGVADDGTVTYEHSYTLEGMSYDNIYMGLLYRNAIGMRVQNQYKGYEHEEEAMLKLTFNAFDVETEPKVISFYKINNDLCVAEIDGHKDLMVSVSDVQDYIDAINKVKNGQKPDYKF